VNKTELINRAAELTGDSRAQTQRTIEMTLSTIERALADGESVTVPGFGSWKVRHQSGRVGKNPQTGKTITIPPHRAARFTAGSRLKNAVR
jgi:nucleoid DNA-binding protein